MIEQLNKKIDIDKVVPFCQEKDRKELLLDRGLLLCLKVNELVQDMQVNIDDVLNYKRDEKKYFIILKRKQT